MGVGPAVGTEWEEHRDEERCGFTFCVRAAKQVKELGYAHNLRVVLRKWPKIWSCDGLFARSGEETEDSDRVLGETC